MVNERRRRGFLAIWIARLFGALLLLIGLTLVVGGVWLAALGGSAYYLIVGAALLAAGWFTLQAREIGPWIYIAAFIGTVAWALADQASTAGPWFRDWSAPRCWRCWRSWWRRC